MIRGGFRKLSESDPILLLASIYFVESAALWSFSTSMIESAELDWMMSTLLLLRGMSDGPWAIIDRISLSAACLSVLFLELYRLTKDYW